MSKFSDACDNWKELGGYIVKVSQPEGVCNTMCKYWIALREQDMSGEDTISYFIEGGEDLASKGGKQHAFSASVLPHLRKGQKKGGSRTPKIPGWTATNVGGRTLGIGNLRSRDDLLNFILGGAGGLFLFSASARLWSADPAHAMAFDTRVFPERRFLYFMDPNGGQFWHDNADEEGVEAAFRTLYREYWELIYKKYAHTGGRELYRYARGSGETKFHTMVINHGY